MVFFVISPYSDILSSYMIDNSAQTFPHVSSMLFKRNVDIKLAYLATAMYQPRTISVYLPNTQEQETVKMLDDFWLQLKMAAVLLSIVASKFLYNL